MALTKSERAEVETIQTGLRAKAAVERPLVVGDYVKPVKKSETQPYDHGVLVEVTAGGWGKVIALGSAMELRWFTGQEMETLWLVDDADDASALVVEMVGVLWNAAAPAKDRGDAANLIRSTLYGVGHR